MPAVPPVPAAPPPPPPAPEPPPPPANKKKDDKSSKGGAKDSSPGKRERTGSLSGELSEDSSSKAFFSDVSYQNAYKTAHDTFDDLKPEDSHESHKNRRLMVVTGGLKDATDFGFGAVAPIGLEDAFVAKLRP